MNASKSSIAFLRGAAIGALVFSLFGGFWAVMTLAFMPGHRITSFAIVALICAALAAACMRRLLRLRHAPRSTDPAALHRGRQQGMRQGMWFGIVFGIECLAIALVSTWLAGSGRGQMIPIALGIIVGVHFLPLARVFHVPMYYATGGLICLIAIGSLFITSPELRQATAGIGTALVLWASAIGMLTLHAVPDQPLRVRSNGVGG